MTTKQQQPSLLDLREVGGYSELSYHNIVITINYNTITPLIITLSILIKT